MDTFYAYKHINGHTYDKNGKRLFITRLQVNPLVVTQVKTSEKDGYDALQVGLGKKNRLNKPAKGHFRDLSVNPAKLKEIRLEQPSEKKKNDQIKVEEIFTVGDVVNVYAVSKGKGFAGTVKRWGFAGGPKTHGQSDRHRAPGSIGQGTTPGRVFKGKKMSGHMGNKRVCVRNSRIVYLDSEKNELWLTGSVPGPNRGLVELKKVNNKKFAGLYQQQVTTKEE